MVSVSLFLVGLLIAVILLVAWGVSLYNALVRLKHGVNKAWANIDVLLKQRHDELPKLVETCKQYMQHERETLDAVISARNAVFSAREQHDIATLGNAETGLRADLGRLFALAESYPDLKANESFQFLQQRMSGLESSIADRRELYNEAVNLNNVRIEQFPDVLITRRFNFGSAELLRFSDAQILDADIKSLFG